ncbi:MAG TPA: HAD family phosphatase [Verrucomicrobiae bacterium]
MGTNGVKAVIFDMDGVIVDSEPCHERAFLDTAAELGYGETHGLRSADYIGRADDDLWRDFIKRHQPPQTLAELLALKVARVAELIRHQQPLFDGVCELVEKMAAHFPLALASGSERLIVDEVLKLRGLGRHFAVTVSATDIPRGRGKPEPDIFLEAAKRLGVAPAACCVIEDSKPGIAAALAAGMSVIAITNTHPEAELGRATRIVQTYAEIERILVSTQGDGA